MVGDQPMAARGGGPITPVVGMASSHVGEVAIELAAPEHRRYRSEELGILWRDAAGPIPEAVAVDLSLSRWGGGGSDVDVQLAGADLGRLRAAAEEVKRRLREYAGVYEVTDSFRAGKEEMKLGIKPAAEALGLTLQDLGRQVRQAFYGEEAQRIQRGRDDIRVMVRYPRDERRSLGDLENMRIRTPDGGEVPFRSGRRRRARARLRLHPPRRPQPRRQRHRLRRCHRDLGRGRHRRPQRPHPPRGAGPPSRRVLHVRGDDGRAAGRARRAAAGLRARAAADLRAARVPLRSYVQPLIIMTAIPFGLIGAVWGHLFLGLDVSMMSMFGLVAVTGVVVNDSLIMVDFINRARAVHTSVGRMARPAAGRRAVAKLEVGVVPLRQRLLTRPAATTPCTRWRWPATSP